MKDVSFADPLCFVQNVRSLPIVASELPVGARLHQFREIWTVLVASLKVITVCRDGYTPLSEPAKSDRDSSSQVTMYIPSGTTT